MAVVASYFADRLRRSGKLTTSQTRKSFTAFAVIIPGLLMIAQIFYGMDRTFAVVIFTLQLLFNGAVTAGYLGNGLDIAPNFSGTIFGMANTLSSLGGFLSAYMVGTLTKVDVSLAFNLFGLSSTKELCTISQQILFFFFSTEILRTMANCVRCSGLYLHIWRYILRYIW